MQRIGRQWAWPSGTTIPELTYWGSALPVAAFQCPAATPRLLQLSTERGPLKMQLLLMMTSPLSLIRGRGLVVSHTHLTRQV